MTTVFKDVGHWNRFRNEMPNTTSLGCVPTLGGLHEGHLSLVRRSLEENETTVVSIFLNRVQFNNASDYENYPANFEEDVAKLKALGVDAIFSPAHDQLYPDFYRYRIIEDEESRSMEGTHRPGHFDGVLTVVMKLLNILRPNRAYFGEKDYQQLQLVKKMTEAFFLPVKVVSCPTIRDANGLALSSRNRRLTSRGLVKAARFPEILVNAENVELAVAELKEAGFEVEYIEERGGRRFGAVVLENVRLIDNVSLNVADAQLRSGMSRTSRQAEGQLK